MKINLNALGNLVLLLTLTVFLNPDFQRIELLKHACYALCILFFIIFSFKKFSLSADFKWRSLFVIWAFLSWAIQSSSVGGGYAYMMDVIVESIIFVYVSVLIKRGCLKNVLESFSISTFITCSYACYKSGIENFLIKPLGYYTLGTQLWNSNYVGILTSFAFLCLLIIKSIYKDSFLNNIYLFCMMILIYWVTIIWTGSRTALILGIFIFFSCNLLNTSSADKFLNRFLLSITAVSVILIVIMSNSTLYNLIGIRIESMFKFWDKDSSMSGADGSIAWRSMMIREAISVFEKFPFFGLGIDGFRIYFGSKTGFTTYAHNNYVEMLADGGIIGFLLYYSIFILLFFRYKNSKYVGKKYLLLMAISLLISDFGSVGYRSFFVQILICIFSVPIISEKYISDYDNKDYLNKNI